MRYFACIVFLALLKWWPYVINAGWGDGRGGPELIRLNP